MCNLRKAKNGEEEKILDLVREVLSDYGLEVSPEETDKDLSDLNKFYFNNNGWFSVIDYGGEIIGSYGIYRVHDKVCELRKMYLLPEHHGKGLGRLMMEDAIQQAKALGYTEIVLETNTLLDKAIHLYRKFGFEEYHPSHLSDRCDLAMRKEISYRH
jgi:putative acetyltransferase